MSLVAVVSRSIVGVGGKIGIRVDQNWVIEA